MGQYTPPSPEESASKTEMPVRLTTFWQELKRRKVMRVAITYAVVAWVVIQIASSTFGWFDIPAWAFRLVTLCVILGFPLAVIIAWAFELTPDGIKTTQHAREEQGEVALSKTQERKRNWMAFAFAAAVPTLIFGVLAAVFFFKAKSSDSELSALSSSLSTAVPVEYEKSIAVLPFTNMSADEEHAYFADGVHETILTNLANLGDLRVVSRTSVIQYRDTEKPMPQIGEELKVAYILEGSMQRAGNQFKLTTQLIEAAKDNHLWAKDFTGELTDIFKVQAELAKEITNALKTVLSPQENSQLERPQSASIEAYDLYLQALDIFNSSSDSQKGIELLEKVVELDPTFTDAWLGIAREKGTNYLNGRYRNSEYELGIKRAIDIAARLEPDNPAVLMGLARYYYNCHLNFSRARFYIDQALEKLPHNAELQFLLAIVNRREGNWTESLSHFNRAHRLDPRDNSIIDNFAQTTEMIRDWEKAAVLRGELLASPLVNFRSKYRSARTHFYARGSLEEVNRLFSEADHAEDLENRRREWLYLTGNLKAFATEGLVDTFEHSNLEAVGALMPIIYSILHQAIVLTALEKFDQREEVFDLIYEIVERRAKTTSEDFRGQLAMGLVQALKGNIEEAQSAIDLAVAIRPESSDAYVGSDLATERAIAMAWMGKKDEAVSELSRLSKKPNLQINYYALKNSLSFLPLRDHSGFQALLNDPALKLPIPID